MPTNEGINETATAFEGAKLLAQGALDSVAKAVKQAVDAGVTGPVFVYGDSTGELIEIDTRGTADEVVARVCGSNPQPGPGRPRLGVVAREVTLLPRHWDWLASQPGGASVALRKLVEEARRSTAALDRQRKAKEAAYRFLSSMAGDFPGFEESLRALFAYDRQRFAGLIAAWPEDVRDYAIKLAFADAEPALTPQ